MPAWNASGYRALLLSVMYHAHQDWQFGDEKEQREALCYFGSPIYRHHCELADIPSGWLPDGVTPAAIEDAIQQTLRLKVRRVATLTTATQSSSVANL